MTSRGLPFEVSDGSLDVKECLLLSFLKGDSKNKLLNLLLRPSRVFLPKSYV